MIVRASVREQSKGNLNKVNIMMSNKMKLKHNITRTKTKKSN